MIKLKHNVSPSEVILITDASRIVVAKDIIRCPHYNDAIRSTTPSLRNMAADATEVFDES